MKKTGLFICFVISFFQIKSQCFEIQSILVDACAGSQEGQNEMVTFQVGNTALNTTNLSVNWPNNSWLGLTKDAGTAADVATVNSTIIGCGLLKEPTAGVLPANSKVLLVTSTAWTPLAQNFVNLNDTLYIIFQTVGNTSGHFANFGTGLRTLSMTFSLPSGCTDAVTYDRALLLNQSLMPGAQDGGAVEFTSSGVASYVNQGCQAPYIPLTVDAGNNTSICIGSIQNYTATVSGTYTSINWSLGAGATGTFVPTNSLSTTYTPGSGDNGMIKLYCTILKTCGSQTTTVRDSVTLTLLELPNPVISAATNTLCSGNTSVLTYSLTNAASVGTISALWSPGSATTNSISVSTANIYSVQISNLCGNNTATISITSIPSPTVTLSSMSPTACANATVALSASSNAGNFNWSNPVSTNSNVVVSSSTTTTGVVTTTNSCGSDSKTYTLTIIPTPTISVDNSNVNLCAGQSATVTATSNALSYTWNPGGVNTNSIVLNSAGVYTVSTTNSCGSATATVNVSISSAPTLSIISSVISICASGQTATLSLSGSAGSYTWSTGVNTSTTLISSPGVYSASVSTPGCGTAVANISLGTAPLPIVSIAAPSSNSLCAGGSVILTANSNAGNYLWSNGATTNTVSVSSSSVTVTSTNACGSSQATQTLNVIPIPTITLSTNALTLCSGLSATVQANSNTTVTYSWSSGATTNLVSLNSVGVYTANVSNTCGNASETVTVSAGVSPSVTVSASQTLVCTSFPSTTVTATGNAGTYLWNNGAITSTTTVLNSGLYTVTLTNSCGQAVSSISITVSSMPTVAISPQSSQLCPSYTGTLIATSGNAGNFIWSTGVTGTNTILVPTAGIYTVTVSNLCGTKTATASVGSLTMTPIVITPSSYSICPNETATLTVTGGVLTGFGMPSYAWSNSTTTGSINATTGGVVTVLVTNFCGTYTESITVNVNSLSADIVANPTSGYNPLIVSFTNNSTNATGYFWDFGNGNIANTQTVTSQTYNQTGSYTVYLTVTSGVCMDIDSVVVTVLREEPYLIIPNVFTPNNDSINDVFRVTGVNIKEFSCFIFDRWGLQLFSWSDIKKGWDGKTNGKESTDGTYFYIINAKDIEGVEIKKQGAFSLFK